MWYSLYCPGGFVVLREIRQTYTTVLYTLYTDTGCMLRCVQMISHLVNRIIHFLFDLSKIFPSLEYQDLKQMIVH